QSMNGSRSENLNHHAVATGLLQQVSHACGSRLTSPRKTCRCLNGFNHRANALRLLSPLSVAASRRSACAHIPDPWRTAELVTRS
ncbi:hypothetical protein, partial [Caballeronia zhejiangensis]|uniref:hypothetical protein n=1 Tax=Caballeronia zhejiangensis TaxID=871203 RepID=UPI001F266AEA